ncbi:MAG: hypothetical protein FWE27_04230 [Defluviitaleaceae bacterium]|nr:hypothetical protein [Defluviitaleaceae bacterium]
MLWGVNDILLWLPNLSTPGNYLFATITTIGTLPPDVYLSDGLLRVCQLSRHSNYALIAGAVAFVNYTVFSKSS